MDGVFSCPTPDERALPNPPPVNSARSDPEAGFRMTHERLLSDSAARLVMVETQLVARGIRDRRLLEAMSWIPREMFVPAELQEMAYEDRALPIGYGQTISQPYTVAYMIEALGLQGTEVALEVGTGSGYSAAVLACLARRVYSVERIAPLTDAARERLRWLGLDNVDVRTADGTLGLPDEGPFDAIVVTAGGEGLPPPHRNQLTDRGRIVIPLGPDSDQILTRYTRRGSQLLRESLGDFAFVPLIGVHGRSVGEPWAEGY
jgi:protein-L-isoaspartate(D-aspartate) O-methyltransferase